MVYVKDGGDYAVISMGGISGGDDYATIINSELLPLFNGSLDVLLEQKVGHNHDLMEINVTGTVIEAEISFPD